MIEILQKILYMNVVRSSAVTILMYGDISFMSRFLEGNIPIQNKIAVKLLILNNSIIHENLKFKNRLTVSKCFVSKAIIDHVLILSLILDNTISA